MDRQMLEQYIKRQVRKTKKQSPETETNDPDDDKKAQYMALPDYQKRQFVRAEEQGATMRIAVRFYHLRKPITQQHSYIVGVEMGGLSEDNTTIVEISRTATFRDLRVKLEEKKDRGMVRRTITFQALRHLMEICENPHNYNDKQRRTQYRLGIMESDDADKPTLLTLEDEVVASQYLNIQLVSYFSQVCPITDKITDVVFEQPIDQLVIEDKKRQESGSNNEMTNTEVTNRSENSIGVAYSSKELTNKPQSAV